MNPGEFRAFWRGALVGGAVCVVLVPALVLAGVPDQTVSSVGFLVAGGTASYGLVRYWISEEGETP